MLDDTSANPQAVAEYASALAYYNHRQLVKDGADVEEAYAFGRAPELTVVPNETNIAQFMLGQRDSIVVINSDESSLAESKLAFDKDRRVKVVSGAEHTSTASAIPPIQKNGLGLWEVPPNDKEYYVDNVLNQLSRWPTATHIVAFHLERSDNMKPYSVYRSLKMQGFTNVLGATFYVNRTQRADTKSGLNGRKGFGFAIVNPPANFKLEMKTLAETVIEPMLNVRHKIVEAQKETDVLDFMKNEKWLLGDKLPTDNSFLPGELTEASKAYRINSEAKDIQKRYRSGLEPLPVEDFEFVERIDHLTNSLLTDNVSELDEQELKRLGGAKADFGAKGARGLPQFEFEAMLKKIKDDAAANGEELEWSEVVARSKALHDTGKELPLPERLQQLRQHRTALLYPSVPKTERVEKTQAIPLIQQIMQEAMKQSKK